MLRQIGVNSFKYLAVRFTVLPAFPMAYLVASDQQVDRFLWRRVDSHGVKADSASQFANTEYRWIQRSTEFVELRCNFIESHFRTFDFLRFTVQHKDRHPLASDGRSP